MTLARVFAIGWIGAVTLSLSAISLGQQPDPQVQDQPPPRRVSIMGPLTSGGPAQRIDPPSLEEVLAAIADQPDYAETAKWAQTHKDNLRVTKDVIADYIDPPRFYPLVGPAQRHHAHYRVSLRRKKDGPVRVIIVDHNHMHTIRSASLTIRAGTPPYDKFKLDTPVRNQLESWNHTMELFGPTEVNRFENSVVVAAKQVSLNLRLTQAIRFQANGQELSIQLMPDRALKGTLRGDVQMKYAGESLRCDSLTFSSDGKVIASGGVKLSGTNIKTDGQLRLADKPLGVKKETVLQRLPSGKSPIVDFTAEQVELHLNNNTITVHPAPDKSVK